MEVILDANIIFSAMISDSTTRKIIKNSEISFYYPESALESIIAYKEELMHKGKLSEYEFYSLLLSLFKKISIIPDTDMVPVWERSEEIMLDIDKEDVLFIAAALSMKNSVIWTNDKHFQLQKEIKIITTKDII
tara:strand:- start:3928 stop:4329 length:402 start_codon:yes stop_codon:yes gene_type:complete